MFTLSGPTGGITEVGEILDAFEPYPDTDAGCAGAPARVDAGVKKKGQ